MGHVHHSSQTLPFVMQAFDLLPHLYSDLTHIATVLANNLIGLSTQICNISTQQSISTQSELSVLSSIKGKFLCVLSVRFALYIHSCKSLTLAAEHIRSAFAQYLLY
jgi:hypothetical protein